MNQVRAEDEFRVVYVGAPHIVAALREDFLRTGAVVKSIDSPHVLSVGPALTRRITAQQSLGVQNFVGATVQFLSDVLEVAKFLPQIDADLLIVDERLHLAQPMRKNMSSDLNNEDDIVESENGPVLQKTMPSDAEESPITFEVMQQALGRYTSRDFHYPSRRILVVLPRKGDVAKRTFQLGLASVRGVIVEPNSSVELFIFATRQLHEFRKNQVKTSINISGGGLEGYIYALGACQALEDSLLNKDCRDFDIYCGVSSGALLSSCFAAGISSTDLIKQLYRRTGKLEALTLGVIFDPAGSEIVKRIFHVVRGFSTLDAGEVVARLQRLVPVGFFKGEKLKLFIERQLERIGFSDNMAAFKKEVYISVTDQDTGEHVVFGEEPWRDIRISQAIRASTALPPFYLPERINGHWFTDGQLTSSSDFNIAIRKGAGLVIIVDPMVAYTSSQPGAILKHGGYFTAIQAIKSLVQTRAKSMLKHSMDMNPDVDFVVFQPTDEVMEAMAGNPMRYRIRTEVAELGYRGTLSQILENYDSISHKLAKHGFYMKPIEEIRTLLR